MAVAYTGLVIIIAAFTISHMVYAPLNVAFESPSQSLYRILNPDGEEYTACFASIQEAINDANTGATITVPSGTYSERLIVNKTVSLIAESRFAAIVDGSGGGTVVEITAHNVTISGFSLQNSGYGWTRHGIYVYKADNCLIENNHMFMNCHNVRLNYSSGSTVQGNIISGVMTQPTMYGIRVENSVSCTVEGNRVSDCVGAVHLQNATSCVVARNVLDRNSQGLRFYTPCAFNEVFENNVFNNSYDGMVVAMPDNVTLVGNRVFHNSFINNSYPFVCSLSGIAWDDSYPSGGNYWSRYSGTDLKSGSFQNETGYDGMGDIYYSVSPTQRDNYPLMHPYGSITNMAIERVFLTIVSAVNSPATSTGHVIAVKKGVYPEHLTLSKALTLLGENQSNTIIDGGGFGTVVAVEACNVTIAGFTIRNSGSYYPTYGNDCGLFLNRVAGCNISFNIFTGNRIGVYMFHSDQNILEGNIVHSNSDSGVWLWHSGNNTLKRNMMFDNTYNFGVFGSNFKDFDNDIDTSNKIGEKPIRYIVNKKSLVFDENVPTSALYLINCVNITVRNLNLLRTGQGVLCYNVTGSVIQNLTVSGNNYGIDMLRSYNNIISDVRGENNWVGIRLENSMGNTVKNNVLVACEKGISLYEASMNLLEGNTLRDNIFGVRLSTSHSNHIYRNNFIQNTAQVDLVSSNQNAWNDGVEGNFWSNHQSSDDDKNGLADNEHLIDAKNKDTLPLSGVFHSFEVDDGVEVWEVAVISNSTVNDVFFESSNRTLILTVEGSNDTLGFCRVRVPHGLIEPELAVVIDGGLAEVTYANYSLLDNGFCRWIYFEYEHSIHEIVILNEFRLFGLWLLLAFSSISVLLLLKSNFVRRGHHFDIAEAKPAH